jgi:dimeric dUTPase (all-alpha-NTP-PPase superfamily)
MNIELTPLLAEQAKLDAHIQQQHQVSYASTREKRILALLVEVGEMINETKCFKFWSKKPPNEKAIILDGYADGIHFFLSLGIEVKSQKKMYELIPLKGDLVHETIEIFDKILQFKKQFTVVSFENAFAHYLSLMPLLGFSEEEMIDGYFKKLGVNYTRQKTNY